MDSPAALNVAGSGVLTSDNEAAATGPSTTWVEGSDVIRGASPGGSPPAVAVLEIEPASTSVWVAV